MATKRNKPEEFFAKLRQVEVRVGQGMARVNQPKILFFGKSRPVSIAGWKRSLGGLFEIQGK